MSVNIVIPSVPHTGTKFVASLFPDLRWSSFTDTPNRPAKYIGHIINEGMYLKAIDLVMRNKAIIPLRHPYRVAESWRRRGKPLNKLIEGYRRLPELTALGAYVLPIDSSKRTEYLDQISEGLGVQLATDWSVKNSVAQTYDLIDLPQPPELRVLVQELDGFLTEFYPLP